MEDPITVPWVELVVRDVMTAGLDLLVATGGREAGGGRRAGLSYQVGALITSRSTTPT